MATTETDHSVGQVLYVVLRKEARVYPVQVIKRTVEHTLAGISSSYTVRGGKSEQSIPLDDIDGEVFDSAEEAKKTLTSRAIASISQRVAQAVAKAQEWYQASGPMTGDDLDAPPVVHRELAPQARPQQQPRPTCSDTETLARELQQESDQIAGKDGQMMIKLADGRMAKVRNVEIPPSMRS